MSLFRIFSEVVWGVVLALPLGALITNADWLERLL